ncbi:MAG: TrkA family potassium uptake protein [Fibrobacter sp.]|jgi:trk system potassium uptake protein TrkA|nr:TrkA family potassium uptake protein [Fibrobacter sp.]
MSSKQFVVIGLGNSGYFLARHLTALGHDVLVIDSSPEKIQDITSSVSQAAVADSTRKKQLAALPLTKVDSVVVCIGEDLEASLLTVLNLKELGVKHIIAKSSSPAHTTILEKLGVSDIFHPERDMSISLAERMNRPNMLDYLPFMEGFSIIELACPEKFIGKSLKELSLTSKYGVQVIAIRDPLEIEPKLGNLADYILQERDVLFIIGPNKVLDKIKD